MNATMFRGTKDKAARGPLAIKFRYSKTNDLLPRLHHGTAWEGRFELLFVANIATVTAANAWLPEFIADYNQRFGCPRARTAAEDSAV